MPRCDTISLYPVYFLYFSFLITLCIVKMQILMMYENLNRKERGTPCHKHNMNDLAKENCNRAY